MSSLISRKIVGKAAKPHMKKTDLFQFDMSVNLLRTKDSLHTNDSGTAPKYPQFLLHGDLSGAFAI